MYTFPCIWKKTIEIMLPLSKPEGNEIFKGISKKTNYKIMKLLEKVWKKTCNTKEND